MTARLAVLSSQCSDAGPLARVRVGPAGMSADCPRCRVFLEQSPGADPRAALRGFLEAHPLSRHAAHSAATPTGWLTRDAEPAEPHRSPRPRA